MGYLILEEEKYFLMLQNGPFKNYEFNMILNDN